ncbi:MAG: hypothetical protein MAG715_00249 [Methanonatronarchaeales archaeon]|nr:hypothetical protein [Methanonatronarchaeales archaeon]
MFLFLPFADIYLAGARRGKPAWKEVAVIGSLFYLSHLVFDFFQTGLIPLYPIDTTWVKATATLHLDGLMPIAGVETEFVDVPAGGRSPSRPLPLVSPDSLGVAVFSLPFLVYFLWDVLENTE